MLIRNYGLFWKTENVHWGWQSNAGHLKGQWAKGKEWVVDFRDQAGIYVLYADYKLVYVGQAGNGEAKLFDRLKAHRANHLANRWNMFSWFGTRRVIGLESKSELGKEPRNSHSKYSSVLNHLEAILIHSAEPPLNRQGGKWGNDVEQYLQVRDHDALGPPVDEMIEELWRRKAQG